MLGNRRIKVYKSSTKSLSSIWTLSNSHTRTLISDLMTVPSLTKRKIRKNKIHKQKNSLFMIFLSSTMLMPLKRKWETFQESEKKFSSVIGQKVMLILKTSSDTNNSWPDNISEATFGRGRKSLKWSLARCCWTWCKLWHLQKWHKRTCKRKRKVSLSTQKMRLKKLKDEYEFLIDYNFDSLIT